jgi:hypothetical protein
VYCEEQQKNVEEKRLTWEAEWQRRCNDLKTWEYHIAKAEEKNIRAREAECVEMTFETWLLPRPEEGTFLGILFKFEE